MEPHSHLAPAAENGATGPCSACSGVLAPPSRKSIATKPSACMRGMSACLNLFCDPFSGDDLDRAAARLRQSVLVHEHGPESEYDVGKVLGSGAFADVRIATEKASSEEVAIKYVRRKGLSPTEDEFALEEARVLALLSHDNVMRFYGFYETKEHYCLVLELMKGGELFDSIVKRSYYSENCARHIVKEMLEVLSYCHARNIMHRDLKPENLLLPEPGNETLIKVGDWGFATELKDANGVVRDPVGTPGYAAPEVLRAQPYSCKADVFSAGVIVYVLLAGYRPFEGPTARAQITATINEPLKFHETHWEHISQEAKDLVSGMLDKNPATRFSADEALAHPWMLLDREHLESCCLGSCCTKTLPTLKKFRARERLRSVVSAVVAANRLKSLLGDVRSASQRVDSPSAAEAVSAGVSAGVSSVTASETDETALLRVPPTPSERLEEPLLVPGETAGEMAGKLRGSRNVPLRAVPIPQPTPGPPPVCGRAAARRKTLACGVPPAALAAAAAAATADAEAADGGADSAAGSQRRWFAPRLSSRSSSTR